MDPSTRDLVLQSIRDLEFAPAPKKPSKCAQCDNTAAHLRCLYCFDAQFLCTKCMVDSHAQNPLHRIEMWTNTGLRTPDNDFVILDTDGLHEVAIDYCSCDPHRSHGKQLREARFFPSSDSSPRTAVAFKMAQIAAIGAVPITMHVGRTRRGLNINTHGNFKPKTRAFVPDKRVTARSSSMNPPLVNTSIRSGVDDMGRTDGETPERKWAEANPTTSIQREMGPCARHQQLELTKDTDKNHADYKWLPGLDLVYQEYLDTLKTAEIVVADKSEDSMDLGYVDVDDEDDIREPWVINIDRPYSAGSAKEKQMQLLTDACWPRTGSRAVGTGTHIVGSRFNVGVPLEPYRFLDERTDPKEFSLLEGIHMRYSVIARVVSRRLSPIASA
ncbi:hypothetical protein B0H11DRAFT_1903777 [Mycena galericulata]|nr:hypothetical protein B0H11DRAFT_1903777 [Mycena galericulata]